MLNYTSLYSSYTADATQLHGAAKLPPLIYAATYVMPLATACASAHAPSPANSPHFTDRRPLTPGARDSPSCTLQLSAHGANSAAVQLWGHARQGSGGRPHTKTTSIHDKQVITDDICICQTRKGVTNTPQRITLGAPTHRARDRGVVAASEHAAQRRRPHAPTRR